MFFTAQPLCEGIGIFRVNPLQSTYDQRC
jgi:hypothetical protein